MSPPSLLIIDDHPVYRDALRDKLAAEFTPDNVQVLAVGSAHEGLDRIDQDTRRWIVLLDILMPGLSGLAGIKAFKSKPHVEHVVAISGLEEHLWEPRTVAAGASMFLSKNSTSEHICQKLAALLANSPATLVTSDALEPKQFRLTSRQHEVLTLIAQGLPNKVIADFLDISEQTVKIHINHLFRELRVFNRTQAVLKAKKHQLI